MVRCNLSRADPEPVTRSCLLAAAAQNVRNLCLTCLVSDLHKRKLSSRAKSCPWPSQKWLGPKKTALELSTQIQPKFFNCKNLRTASKRCCSAQATYSMYVPSVLYMCSICLPYFFSATARFNFLVGVNSPPSSEKL